MVRDFISALTARRPPKVGNAVLLSRVDSTNALARRIVAEYLREEMDLPAHLVVAYEQTAGRGRRGRTWTSPAGCGVYATVCVPITDTAAVARLPLAVGVALCRTLQRLAGVEARLKWPNDLLVGGRKLGGILIETVAQGQDIVAAVVGFGVNYGGAGDALPSTATSLEVERAGGPALDELVWPLVESVQAGISIVGDLAELVSEYGALSAHRDGDRLACQVGEERIEGTFRGFDATGRLRLDVEGAERTLGAGEVLW